MLIKAKIERFLLTYFFPGALCQLGISGYTGFLPINAGDVGKYVVGQPIMVSRVIGEGTAIFDVWPLCTFLHT